MCARVQSCGVAHGLLILERFLVEQQEPLATLGLRSKAARAIKHATFERHIEAGQVGGRGEAHPAQIVNAESTLADQLHQSIEANALRARIIQAIRAVKPQA